MVAIPRKLTTGLVSLFLIALATACTDAADPTAVLEPQFARKVKPDPVSKEPVLQEYWVVPGAADQPDTLHIVWSGAGTAVNPSVVWDHNFNSIRDDDAPADAHYEFYYSGPPKVDGTEVPGKPGWFHADIPWNGLRVYDNPSTPYPAQPGTEVDGEGDPYAFKLYFSTNSGSVGSVNPFGVVVGGVNVFGEMDKERIVTESVAGDLPDGGGMVRSFATFEGADPTGTISIAHLSLQAPQCKVSTVTTGRGKNKVSATQTTISGDVTLLFAKTPDITLEYGEYIWFEGHFLDEDSGTISRRIRPNINTLGSYSLSATMPEGWTGGTVSFAVDYVVSSASPESTDLDHRSFADYVYDPGANDDGVRTMAGFLDATPWSAPSSAPDNGLFPVARTLTFDMDCGPGS